MDVNEELNFFIFENSKKNRGEGGRVVGGGGSGWM